MLAYRVPKMGSIAYNLICLAFDFFPNRNIGPHFDIDATNDYYSIWRPKTLEGELWLLANLPTEATLEEP